MTVLTKENLIDALAVFKELIYEDIAANYVAKDGAKVLSTNDFTDALKAKLDGIVEEEISRSDIENLFAKGGASAGNEP